MHLTAPSMKGIIPKAILLPDIVRVIATDEDNDTLIYSIKEQGTPFTIDALGIITATGIIDYEALSSYTLTIEVTDGETPVETNLTIAVGDVNEPPAWTTASGTASIPENIPEDTLITTIPAASGDEGDIITYSLKTNSDHTNRFAFNTTNRHLTTGTGTFDYSTTSSYDVIIIADDGNGLTTEYTLTVMITASSSAYVDWETILTSQDDYDSGAIRYGTLPDDITLRIGDYAFTFKSNTLIEFHENGVVSSGNLSSRASNIQIGDHTFTFHSDNPIHFHETSVVIQGIIVNAVTVGDTTYATNKWILFYADDGEIASSSSSYSSSWTGG